MHASYLHSGLDHLCSYWTGDVNIAPPWTFNIDPHSGQRKVIRIGWLGFTSSIQISGLGQGLETNFSSNSNF